MSGLERVKRWAWLVGAGAVLFLFLGTRGLNEPDEGRYAEICREMAATGEWLVPHLNGFEHFQKPPLLYWATALSIRAWGANEWAARLPSALAALGVVIFTFLIARRFLDRERAAAAALVLLSSVEFFALARLLTPDMALTFWVTASLAALIHRRHWLFFVCMGFGFMTKGPMALVVPISAALGWQFAARRRGESESLPWMRGLAVTLALGLAWFVVLSLRSRELFEYFWRYELLERFASSAHGRSKPFWFFGPVLLVGFLPWTFCLPTRVRSAWRRLRAGDLLPLHGLLLGWVLPPLLILSLSGSKLVTYVLPLFPALALLVAMRLRAAARLWRIAIPATACWLAVAALAPRFEGMLRQQSPVRALAIRLSAQSDAATARLFACEVRAHGWEFYSGRLVSVTKDQADVVLPISPGQEARLFDSPEECEREFAQGRRSYGIIRSARLATTFAPGRWTAMARSGDFVLVTNQPSPNAASPPLIAAARL